MPRSSRWLLANGEVNEAKQSLQFIYSEDVHEIFEFLQKEVTKTITCTGKEKQNPSSFIKTLQKASSKAIIASVGLVIFQQFSGQPSLISYVTILFSSAGLSGDFSIWTAILMAFAASFTVCMVDRLGRKILLKSGCLLMLVALVVLSITFRNFRANGTDQSSYFSPLQQVVVVICLLVYVASYQLCFGPLTWLIVSEVFPIDIRGEATAFLVELNYCLNFLVQFLIPCVQAYIGWSITFSFFACVLALALYFIDAHVPETNGMTLEAIENDLQENVASISTSEKSLLRMRFKSVDSFKTFEQLDHTSSVLCP
jgi:MFS transporter, SP family, galactose:H+ symporter